MTGTPTKILTGRYLVRRRQIIDASLPSNSNCCGREEKKQQPAPSVAARKPIERDETVPSPPSEFIIEVPKQSAAVVSAVAEEKAPLFYELLCNAWPSSTERVENLAITWKRCQFSNEAISIKPITAIPGIGKKYGQILADHGFIYARQLLGYYMILKDGDMFRKWLEYQFQIPTFRAAEGNPIFRQ